MDNDGILFKYFVYLLQNVVQKVYTHYTVKA